MDSRNVDIIIPIYNAFDDLVQCIASIRKWTDLTRHRLVLIDDCSTDERMGAYLEEQQDDHCIVIYNQTNQGFSWNINTGIAQSQERDVILLNSDTVVTKNWLQKLLQCAYADAWTATVTPLSNNATLCSVPYFCRENKLPRGYTTDTYAALVENVSLNKYPTIPVANGFCMLIKREIIQIIGNFDAGSFGKGYGEENDFCYRAIEVGYHHVMCDNTFILHTGTSSFEGNEKKKYIHEHEKILDERYPQLMQEVRVHCKDNPTGIISHNIRMRTKLENCKKRNTVMYLLQADFRDGAQDNVGGTQLHVKDLVHGLRGTYNVLVAARNFDYLNVTFYAEKEELFYQFYIGPRQEFELFRSSRLACLFGRILDAFAVGCVHIHHTAGLSLELYYEAKKRRIAILTTFHDYYCVCPNVKLLDDRKKVCTGQKQEHCRKCLKKQKGVAETLDYIKEWRKQQLEAVSLSEKVIVPSEHTAQIIQSYYPDLERKMLVISHGLDQPDAEKRKHTPFEKQTFHIAFLGALNAAKGFEMAVSLIKKESRGIDWYLFGYFEQSVPELERKKNFHNIGPYQRDELPKLIKQYQIDLVCILPIWQETFCYTLSEAIQAGVPVLATQIGAVGARVTEMECGWTVPHMASCEKVMERIWSIRNNTADYEIKLRNVCSLKLKTEKEMCEEYRGIYNSAFQKMGECRYGKVDNEWLIRGYLMMEEDPKMNAVLRYKLESAERQLNEVYHSASYKAMLMLAKMPIPFRKQIKGLVRKVYGYLFQ